MRLGWATLARVLVAFLLWSLIGGYLFPAYSKVILSSTSSLLEWLRPHGLALSLENEYPYLSWRFDYGGGPQYERMSFTLFVYNALLFLALVTGLPGLSLRGRLLFVASGAPLIYLFHVVDLSLAIEGRLLSVVEPEHARFLQEFSLWYSLVKLYNFLSIMAVKQVVLLGLFYLQWITLPRWAPWVRSTR